MNVPQLAGIDLLSLEIGAGIVALFFLLLLIVATKPGLKSIFTESPDAVLSSRRFAFVLLMLVICVALLYLTLATRKFPDLPPVLFMFLLFLVGAIAAPQIIDLLKGKIGIPPGGPS